MTIPRLIPSHGNVIRIRFKSDGTSAAPGFRIYWDGTSTGCGGELTSTTGTIWSPNYPQSYGHNAECSWVISVSKGSQLQLRFEDFDVEAGENCKYDFLEVSCYD